jgi:hypothetical protein
MNGWKRDKAAIADESAGKEKLSSGGQDGTGRLEIDRKTV